MPESAIPAGWYPDPAGSFQQRWWDGTAWTNDFAQYRPTLVHSAPAAEALQARAAAISGVSYGQQQNAAVTHFASGQVPAAAVQAQQTQTLAPVFDPLPSFNLPPEDRAPLTSVAQPNAGNATLIAVQSGSPKPSVPAVNPSFANDYLPFGQIPEVRHGQRQSSEFRYTASVWVLAVLPAVVVAVAIGVATLIPAVYTTFIQLIVLVLAVFASVALVVRDRFSLRREGHDDAASPAWILLSPLAYLAARSFSVSRETGRATWLPFILLVVVSLGLGAGFALVPGLAALITTANGLY